MHNPLQRGFTLIELLVVIAIIGILVGVVLPRLQEARDGGIEVRIKGELTAIAKQAALEESRNLSYDTVCGSGGETQAAEITRIITSIESFASTTVTCNSVAEAYAVSVPLNTTGHWCVDSTGARSTISAALVDDTDYACPDS